jgi:hypothetical protein
MMRKLGLLVAGTGALWVLVLVPARMVWGDRAVVESAVAAALCLIPMSLTLVWSIRAQGGSAEGQLAAAMGGTAIRLFVVILGAVVLYLSIEELNEASFMVWVVFFYLATLTLEIVLVLRHIAARPEGF